LDEHYLLSLRLLEGLVVDGKLIVMDNGGHEPVYVPFDDVEVFVARNPGARRMSLELSHAMELAHAGLAAAC
jgi:hypothetical protein